MAGRWQFWIDRGGTFTDIVARSSEGQIVLNKLLSERKGVYDDAAVAGIGEVLREYGGSVGSVRMGTTVGTNALLERKGARVLLVVNRGFRDILRIGYQNRPSLFDLDIQLPGMLYGEVLEVNGRMNSDGIELEPVDDQEAEEGLRNAYTRGYRSVAIVLMHSCLNGSHERKIADLAEMAGFSQISTSYEVSPLIKIVGRGDTTAVDAYLSPLLRGYIDDVREYMGSDAGELLFMQSNGGLIDHTRFRGKDCILSGPAGGIVGGARTSASAGYDRVVTFDMGGTSTDVSLVDGGFERTFDSEIASFRIRAPMLNIHTVAAGGGSILHFDGARFSVGPDSAGAYPGPACYRNGGPLTITDCNVALGRIQPEHFPSVFGSGREPIDTVAVKEGFLRLAARINEATGKKRSGEEVAEGFLSIAVNKMAEAIKSISIKKGHDVSQFALCCFGGAGGQHACKVADSLGIKTILLHRYAGVLSAYGLGLSDRTAMRERSIEEGLSDELVSRLFSIVGEMEDECCKDLEGCMDEARYLAHLKYSGTDSTLPVEPGPLKEMVGSFERTHLDRYSFVRSGKEILVDSLSVEVLSRAVEEVSSGGDTVEWRGRTARLFENGRYVSVPVFGREELGAETRLEGPALVIEPASTTVIDRGWSGKVLSDGNLVLTREEDLIRELAVGTSVDPVMLEIFNSLFGSIAEQMGSTLQNTAHSVNIKERLDFSCAIFDGRGGLVANAPHIPVHLGSMGESVKSVIKGFGGEMEEGDAFLLNSPFAGGTHLPDVTVVSPIFIDGEGPTFYAASRGHHADIGGTTPGSMPPDSSSIHEEGVLTGGMKIVHRGSLDEEGILGWLSSGRFPARRPQQNLADIAAQVAANGVASLALTEMADRYSLETVSAYMGHVKDNARESVKRVINVLSDGSFSCRMDDGARIAVRIGIDREKRSAVLDFAGTSPQRRNNFNAPPAVCRACVLYVFRCLVDGDIPLNDGCLEPLEIRIPEGSMLSPREGAAVAAGNVETSQYIVDALLGALGILGGSQGTMNNLTFGDAGRQYYETICGGAGAGDGFCGASGVHTHMTNSRITDPEVLEMRFPVLLEEFSIRKGSGGRGRYGGGDGVVRRIRFDQDMTVAVVSGRRKEGAFGAKGGERGAPGENRIIRRNGSKERLPGCFVTGVRSGDRLEIRTPGGGGYGSIRRPPQEDMGHEVQ